MIHFDYTFRVQSIRMFGHEITIFFPPKSRKSENRSRVHSELAPRVQIWTALWMHALWQRAVEEGLVFALHCVMKDVVALTRSTTDDFQVIWINRYHDIGVWWQTYNLTQLKKKVQGPLSKSCIKNLCNHLQPGIDTGSKFSSTTATWGQLRRARPGFKLEHIRSGPAKICSNLHRGLRERSNEKHQQVLC
jgi:hypothetical protein